MKESYFQYLKTLKTYMTHHGRGVKFVHDFASMEVPPEEPEQPHHDDEPQVTEGLPPAGGDLPGYEPGCVQHAVEGAHQIGGQAPGAAPPSDDAPPPWIEEGPPFDPEDASFGDGDEGSGQAPEPVKDDPTRPNIAQLPTQGLTMDSLEQFWSQCLACKLGATRKNLVFGEGGVPAPIMFIGEGPGANEDRLGRPFVGKAGQLLDKMIVAMGLTRDEVYIGNIVKCRPPGNRDPEMDEMLSCMPVLNKQIELIKPNVIVTLGRIAAQALLATSLSLGKLRGRWHEYEGTRLLPTYHPAYLLRNPQAKKMAWEDLQKVMEELNLKGTS